MLDFVAQTVLKLWQEMMWMVTWRSKKTSCEGGLMRVWLTMDQNVRRNNGARVTDNIHSLHQMLVWEKKMGEEKKNLIVWLFGPLSIWSQGYSPPGCSEASSPRDGRLNSNSWVLIFFRHLFALGLPDVSCLAPAPPQPGQGPAHLPVLPAQRWCETFGSHQMCLPKAPRW